MATSTTTTADTPSAPLRIIKQVSRSPIQEYEAREGDTVPLPEAVEAAWLDHYTFAKISGDVITITHQKQSYRFTRADSEVIATYNSTGREFLIRFNPTTIDNAPQDLLAHVYNKENGEYLETLPLESEATRFNYDDDDTQRAISTLAAHNNRKLKRLSNLHQEEAQERLKQERHNAEQLARFSDDDKPKKKRQQNPQNDKLTVAEVTKPPTRHSTDDSTLLLPESSPQRTVTPDPATEAENRIKEMRQRTRQARQKADQITRTAAAITIPDIPEEDDQA